MEFARSIKPSPDIEINLLSHEVDMSEDRESKFQKKYKMIKKTRKSCVAFFV